MKLTSRTAEATGYSECIVQRIVAEKTELDGAAFTSPPKHYRRERKRIDPDHFDTKALRRTVHEFYREKKYPTLDMLLVAVREKGIFSGEHTTLWNFLRKMGFKHRKLNDKRYAYEQARIIVQRHEYLRFLRRNRHEHRPVVYLDETWMNAHDGVEKMWVEDDLKAVGGTKDGIHKPSGKGSTYMYGTFRKIVPVLFRCTFLKRCDRLRSVPFYYRSPFRLITVLLFVSFAACV